MKFSRRVSDHLQRLRHQAGARLRLGPKSYRLRGYISNILQADAAHEAELLPLFGRLLARPGHFIDVGANLGQTLGKVLTLDPKRAYLGFEPQIAACFFCKRFLLDNGLRRMQILPIGLSDEDGIRQFWSRGEADTMASLVQPDDDGTEVTLVPVRRGDQVLAELGIREIAAIKIDVEGAELEVLRGLAGTLAEQRPPVLFEVLRNFTGHDPVPVPEPEAAAQRVNAAALFDFFTAANYAIHQIDARGAEIEPPISAFELDDPAGFKGANYLAKPRP